MADSKVGMDDKPVIDDTPDQPVELKVNLDLAEQHLRDEPRIIRGTAQIPNAKAVAVTTRMEADAAASIVALLASGLKAAEALQNEWGKEPARKLREVRALVEKFSAPLDEAKRALGEKLVAWRQAEQVLAAQNAAVEAKRLHENREARAEGKPVTGPAVEVYPEQAPTTFDTPHGQVTIVGRWTHRITDEAELPDEFWVPNPAAINAAVREGRRVIPGCDIFQRDDIAVRVEEMTDGA